MQQINEKNKSRANSDPNHSQSIKQKINPLFQS